MALYHVQVGFPASLALPQYPFTFRVTRHAQEAAFTDRYGDIKIPSFIHPKDAQVFEVETDESGTLTKMAMQIEYDDYFDLSLVFRRKSRQEPWNLVTVWLNEWHDTHATLDTSRYAQV